MRLLLVGHGRMGRLVEALAPEAGATIAGIIDSGSGHRALESIPAGTVDVVVDFSNADALRENFPALLAVAPALVIGTTGWGADATKYREEALRAERGVVAAANFSLGANLLEALVERAAAVLAPHGHAGAWIHELHHAAKRDAPSGTALMLRAAFDRAGYPRQVDIASTRAGAIPGTHTVGFDLAAETLELTHAVRDRATFARGALVAARWIRGRRGWFTMRDVLGL